jgi:hypothetical protein
MFLFGAFSFLLPSYDPLFVAVLALFLLAASLPSLLLHRYIGSRLLPPHVLPILPQIFRHRVVPLALSLVASTFSAASSSPTPFQSSTLWSPSCSFVRSPPQLCSPRAYPHFGQTFPLLASMIAIVFFFSLL